MACEVIGATDAASVPLIVKVMREDPTALGSTVNHCVFELSEFEKSKDEGVTSRFGPEIDTTNEVGGAISRVILVANGMPTCAVPPNVKLGLTCPDETI